MDISDLDIIYFVKDSAFNEELRYSLRSVEQNFPHNRVVFYGGKPAGLKPDLYFPVVQKGKTKWDKVRDMLTLVCKNDKITDDFVLFNDDFFVMSPIKSLETFADDSLSDLVARIEVKNNYRSTVYTAQLLRAYEALKKAGFSTLNFELHKPMIINRRLMLKTREEFPNIPASRSLYGNLYCYLPMHVIDCKITDLETIPEDFVFVSTDDISFAEGKVGEYIRRKFPKKSRFEC